jgi:hypothetical protein
VCRADPRVVPGVFVGFGIGEWIEAVQKVARDGTTELRFLERLELATARN